jgi:hypothetical protein
MMNESNMPNEWWREQDLDERWSQQSEEELRQYEEESDAPIIFPEFKDALVGYGVQFSHRIAIYDYARCVEILERDGMTFEEAVEWMEYNVLGTYAGPRTPVFLCVDNDDDDEPEEEPLQMTFKFTFDNAA